MSGALKQSNVEHWYVYYKLDQQQLAAWLPYAPRLMAQLRADTGVQGRLLQRADGARETAGEATLMEVYDGIADVPAFTAALDAAVAAARLAVPACAAVSRHTERFAGVRGASATANANA
jgi:hypothetical protein